MIEEAKRTEEEEQYRSEIAKAITTLRKTWNKDLANTFLDRERSKDKYKDTQRQRVLIRDKIRDLDVNDLNEILKFIEQKEQEKHKEEPKPVEYMEQPEPDDEEENTTKSSEKDESEEEKNTIVCPNCGEIDHAPGANFCHMCGKKFNTIEE